MEENRSQINQPQSKLDILIIGGGICGPVLALALQKTTNHNIIIADLGPEELPLRGGPIGMSPNASKAFRFAGAEHVLAERGAPVETIQIGKGRTGRVLARNTYGEDFLKQKEFPVYSIKRDELVAGLRQVVKEHGIEIRHNHRLQKIEEVDNKVTAYFKNGESTTTITADLLVGCDGIHSITRQYVTQDSSQPNFSGMSTILGLATLTPEEENELHQTFSMWIGEDCFFGVTRLDDKGTWGFFHGIKTDDPAGGEVGWNKTDQSIEKFISLSRSKSPGWQAKPPHMVLDKAWRAFALGLYDRKPLECWHRGRVVLCGDAAHPTTPMGGQGGAMAVESAVILARLLGENEPSDELFQRFVQIRRPRTDKVTQNARRGLQNIGITGVWGIIRDLVIWLLGSWFWRTSMYSHYDYDAGKVPLSL